MNKETISSQVFTKNGKFEILEKISKKEDNNYKYYVKIKCIKCGEERIIEASHKERTICKTCKKEEKTNEFIGKVFGTYCVISFDSYKEEYGQTSRYYLVKCNFCGEQSVQNLNHLKSNPKSCSTCRYIQRSINNKPKIQSIINCVRSTYISGAKSRNLEFNLSDDTFEKLIFSDCYYCGSKPVEYQSDIRLNKTEEIFKRNGIDRLDSSLGYTEENCVPCCATCNIMKMSLSHNTFIFQINKIYNYLVNKGSTTISKESTSQANGDGNGELPKKEDDIV